MRFAFSIEGAETIHHEGHQEHEESEFQSSEPFVSFVTFVVKKILALDLLQQFVDALRFVLGVVVSKLDCRYKA